MTLEDVYTLLESKTYYAKDGRKFSFVNNSIHIDRRAFIPFTIYKENETFILEPDTAFAGEKDLRIGLEKSQSESISLYGKISGEELITLE